MTFLNMLLIDNVFVSSLTDPVNISTLNLDKKNRWDTGLFTVYTFDFDYKMSPNETRGNPYKIVKQSAKKTVRLNSFTHRVINNWNNLASEIVCAESVTIFKTRENKSWISARFNKSDIYWKTKTLEIENTGTGEYGYQEKAENKTPFRV